jgi:hypothetical protein
VVELVWSNDAESYAGGSVAIGRASYARQYKGDDLSTKGIPWSSRLRVGREANNPTPSKYLIRYFYKILGMGIMRLRRLCLRNLDLDAEIEEPEKVCRR